MKHSMAHPAATQKPPAKEPHTPTQRTGGRDTASEPALPHERDESVGVTGGVPSEVVQQAHADVRRGLRDTDRGPVADRTYRQLKGGA